jgi:hypothetical protein
MESIVEQQHRCKICGYTSTSESEIRNHVYSEHLLSCVICGGEHLKDFNCQDGNGEFNLY